MIFTLSRWRQWRLFKNYKKRRCTTVNSNIKSSESNKLNTSSSDYAIGHSNLPHIYVQNDNSFNTLSNLKKVADTESCVSINDEIIDENNMSEEISYY